MPGFFQQEQSKQHDDCRTSYTEKVSTKVLKKVLSGSGAEIACRLRDMGWTPERIQEATGLSGEELKNCFLMSSSGILPGCESRSHIPLPFPQFIFQSPDDICLTHPLHVGSRSRTESARVVLQTVTSTCSAFSRACHVLCVTPNSLAAFSRDQSMLFARFAVPSRS